MQDIQQLTRELPLSQGGRLYRGNEHGDLPVDDPPPADHPSEHYEAWRPTSIFSFVPFSSPGGR